MPRRPDTSEDRAPERRPLIDRIDWVWLVVVAGVAVLLRALWVAYLNIDPNDGRFDDSVFYHNAAHLLAQGAGYVDPYGRGPTAQWPPAYPALLAAVYKLFGWHVIYAKLLHVALGAGTVAITYVLGKRIFDRRVAVLGALALASFPGHVYFATLVYAETLFGFLVALALVLTLLWTFEREARWWEVAAIGVVIGLAAMTRVEGIVLVGVLGLFWLLTLRHWRLLVGYGAVLSAGLVLVLLPWTVRNAVEFNEFIVLRTNLTDSLARAADPEVGGIGYGRPAERTDKSVAEALRDQLSDPFGIPATAARKVGDLYENDTDAVRLIQSGPIIGSGVEFEPVLDEDEADVWRWVANRYYFAAGAAALVGVVVALWRRNRGALLLMSAALGWTVLFAYINPVTRYHFPLYPVLGIFAAVTVVAAWDVVAGWLRRTAGRTVGGGSAVRRPSAPAE